MFVSSQWLLYCRHPHLLELGSVNFNFSGLILSIYSIIQCPIVQVAKQIYILKQLLPVATLPGKVTLVIYHWYVEDGVSLSQSEMIVHSGVA